MGERPLRPLLSGVQNLLGYRYFKHAENENHSGGFLIRGPAHIFEILVPSYLSLDLVLNLLSRSLPSKVDEICTNMPPYESFGVLKIIHNELRLIGRL